MKWEGKEQLSFLFLISAVCVCVRFVFFPSSLSLHPRPRSSPSLSALPTLSICFALKESLEQKWNAQLADIQKKWDGHMCEEVHACVSILTAHTHTHFFFSPHMSLNLISSTLNSRLSGSQGWICQSDKKWDVFASVLIFSTSVVICTPHLSSVDLRWCRL